MRRFLQFRLRSLFILTAFAAVASLGLTWLWAASGRHFHLVNDTGQQIRSLNVQVGDESFRLERIPAEGRVSLRTNDAKFIDFSVNAQLEDGTEIGGGCYITDVGVRYKEMTVTFVPGGEVKWKTGPPQTDDAQLRSLVR